MPRAFFTLLFSYFCLILSAQDNSSDSVQSNMARVNVFVTDMKGKASKGESVFFKSDLSQQTFSGRSDAAGKFSLALPVGYKYTITIKSLTDTSKYVVIDIPALGPEEYYTEPFKVNVKYNLAKSYTLDNVHFDFGKATLRPESYAELNELVGFLENKEGVKIEIAGHTDNVGQDTDNLKLSQMRAEAIRGYTIKKGINPARVTAKGYGSAQPVADNATEKGRQLNRRTDVRIL